jgi:D-glycero-D-manno-heptose 1,7-bisphosphate phosphatase
MQRAVFFDKDGVINHLVKRLDGRMTSPWKLDELILFDGIEAAFDLVKSKGFFTFIVTNQPGVDDGDMSQDDLDEIMDFVHHHLKSDGTWAAKRNDPQRYKPNAGMLSFYVKTHNLDPQQCYMIGDRWKDIVPADSLKMKTIFVGDKYESPEHYPAIKPKYTVQSALKACELIVSMESP